jgi:phosphohistidine phosphatase
MLLRHAKADRPHGVSDHDRPLAKGGQAQSKTMGKYMAGQKLAPDLAIVSTARRAQETWQFLQPAFSVKIARRNDARLYEASAHDILQIIKETASSVHALLLVGHNPGFEQLASHLTGTAHPAALSLLRPGCPPAGLIVIDFATDAWAEVSARSGHLERFETPESANGEGF